MMRIAYKPSFCHPLPAGHRFPMIKYELIPEQLIYQGVVMEDQFFEPEKLEEHVLLLTHDLDYWKAVREQQLSPKAMRKIGFPPSKELVDRELEITQGTLDCSLFALEHGAAMNVAGGTHHAYADRGEGFCIFNDFAVASNFLLREGKVKRVLIIDLDVHQGNGTASLMQHEDRVFTFSMHGKDNYPLHKETSDWDIALKHETEDEAYLGLLSNALSQLFDKAKPDIVFYQSGVDILESDKLGKLSVSSSACRQRDELVTRACHQKGLPLVAAMGGGYSPNIKDIVDAHCATFEVIQGVYYH